MLGQAYSPWGAPFPKGPPVSTTPFSACLCLACEQLQDWTVHCQAVSAVYDHSVQLQAHSRTTGAQDKDGPPGGGEWGTLLWTRNKRLLQNEGGTLGELLPSLL